MRSKNNNILESTPTHALLSPTDNSKVLDFINFNNLGSNTINMSNAFKKIQSSTKTNTQELFNTESDFSLKYNKINNLYLNDSNAHDSLYYGIKRQHEYTSSLSLFNNSTSQLDNNSVSKLLDYNFNYNNNTNLYNNTSLYNNSTKLKTNTLNTNINTGEYYINDLSDYYKTNTFKEFGQSIVKGQVNSSLQPNLSLLNSSILNLNTPNQLLGLDIIYKTFFSKSPNQQILSSDRNVRNLNNLNPLKNNINVSSNINDNFISTDNKKSLMTQSTTFFTQNHTPTSFSNGKLLNISYDKFTESGMNSTILSAKEELAPNFIFTPFWSSL